MANGFLQTTDKNTTEPSVNLFSKQGYLSVAYDGEAFLAVGTNGRLDKIYADKSLKNIPVPTKNDLLKVFSESGITLISGTGGVILYSADGENFNAIETGVSSTIYDITFFKGKYYACMDNGRILSSGDGVNCEQQRLETDNDIISIASNGKILMAVTSESDIVTSEDGMNWSIDNFNKTYEGYYDPYVFTGIRNIGDSFFVIGRMLENPDIPYVMVSDTGEVWIQKPLTDIKGIDTEKPASISINAIGYDIDQLLAACDGGRILTISECYACNKIDQYAEVDLKDLALGADKLIIVGDDYVFEILDGTAARQYNIKAEQAFNDLHNGAVIIDVRTDEEYAQGHILGCLHIPVDEIEERLPGLVPLTDTKIIFYCAAGIRSQTALETWLSAGL